MQGKKEILLVACATEPGDKRRLDAPVGSYVDFTYQLRKKTNSENQQTRSQGNIN